jgi:hypothetical protein
MYCFNQVQRGCSEQVFGRVVGPEIEKKVTEGQEKIFYGEFCNFLSPVL